jgi:hypothetical protein
MAIPESQLETWSHQGSVTQSSDTYQTIRRALLAQDSGYSDKSFEVFLQGSYGNDTNIYAESDVDVVIRLDSTFRYDLDSLAEADQQAYRKYVSPATYSFDEFKNAVVSNLQRKFGTDAVSIGKKAVKIKPGQNRRSADVVICYEYRRFKSFNTISTSDYVSGIIFPTSAGDIINYPKQHSSNLTSQHQGSQSMLKPMVRILKNMRSRMVEKNLLKNGVAPSYYLEGMFYNVPAGQYVANSYSDTFVNGVKWLLNADKSKLVCANWQYYLLGSLNVQWNESDFNTFMAGVCSLWDKWD